VRRHSSDLSAGVAAANAGHIYVEKHQVERMPTHRSQSFFAVTSFFNGKSTRGQGKSEYFAQGKFIIDNQKAILP
jgi:hypothetical protein